MKKRDADGLEHDIREQDRSVVSGRNLEEVASGEAGHKDLTSDLLKRAPKTEMPYAVRPMLATLADKPFEQPGWIYEIKWDGFRAIAQLQGKQVELYSRKQQSLNERFGEIVPELQAMNSRAVLDGEIVVADDSGRPRFSLLQNYHRTGEGTLLYYVFDLLYYDGYRLMGLPLRRRKEILRLVLKQSEHVRFSEHVEDGPGLFEVAKEKGLEGIVGKDGASVYQPGIRSESWLKFKTLHQQDAVIGGFTQPRGSRKELGALVLGVYEGGDLVYIGHTGGGLNERELQAVRAKLDAYIVQESPFKVKPKTNTPASWVKPELVCEVRFQEWTKEGYMRHPVFLGLREDKRPRDVKREIPISTVSVAPPGKLRLLAPSRASERKRGSAPRHDGRSKVKPLHLQTLGPEDKLEAGHLDKVFFPSDGFTKGDILDYYRRIARFILPYLKDRPETLHRFPNGIEGEAFYQKDVEEHPDWVETVTIPEADGKDLHYVLCQDEATLSYLVDLGSIEMNPWNSRVAALDCPDYFVIDLDPLDISFDEVVRAARVVRQVLQKAGAPSFCKTSGATGLHVYVPLGARYATDQVVQFAKIIAYLVHDQLPETTSVERSPGKRQECVYLDYLQNRRGQTLVAPYSVRPRPGAPVSTPLRWTEVRKGLDPSAFTIKTIFRRLDKFGDLWQDVLGKGIDLEACLRRLSEN